MEFIKTSSILALVTLSVSSGCVNIPPQTYEQASDLPAIHLTVNVLVEGEEQVIDRTTTVDAVSVKPEEPLVKVVKEQIIVPGPLCKPFATLYDYKDFAYTPGTLSDVEENLRFTKAVMAWVEGVEILLDEGRANADCRR